MTTKTKKAPEATAPSPDPVEAKKAPEATGADTTAVPDAGKDQPAAPEPDEGEVAPELDLDVLRKTLSKVQDHQQGNIEARRAKLKEDCGLEVAQEDGWTAVAMAGVVARARGPLASAIDNWCNAARRALMKAG